MITFVTVSAQRVHLRCAASELAELRSRLNGLEGVMARAHDVFERPVEGMPGMMELVIYLHRNDVEATFKELRAWGGVKVASYSG